MVFLNSPCRETPKNAPKKKSRKKSRMVGGWVWDSADVRGGPSIFFCRPLGLFPAPLAVYTPRRYRYTGCIFGCRYYLHRHRRSAWHYPLSGVLILSIYLRSELYTPRSAPVPRPPTIYTRVSTIRSSLHRYPPPPLPHTFTAACSS
jgi:hypothetical protein